MKRAGLKIRDTDYEALEDNFGNFLKVNENSLLENYQLGNRREQFLCLNSSIIVILSLTWSLGVSLKSSQWSKVLP